MTTITVQRRDEIPYDLRVVDRLDAEQIMDRLLREEGADDPTTSDWLPNPDGSKRLLGYASEIEALHDDDEEDALVTITFEEV
jgi:hypothetical protein